MSDPLSSNWLSVDDSSSEDVAAYIPSEEGDKGQETRDSDSIFITSEEENPRTRRVPIRSHMHFPFRLFGIGMGAIGMVAMIVVFAQGVSFLQASMLQDENIQDEEIQDVLLPVLMKDEGQGTRDTGQGIEENDAIDPESEVSNLKSQIPNPASSQTIRLPEAPSPIATVWPSSLKTNRYTVGSALVPDLSALVSVSLQVAGGQMHDAAPANTPSPRITRAPATGPALWVLFGLCACISPIFWIRRKLG